MRRRFPEQQLVIEPSDLPYKFMVTVHHWRTDENLLSVAKFFLQSVMMTGKIMLLLL